MKNRWIVVSFVSLLMASILSLDLSLAQPLYPKGVTWHVDKRWRDAVTGDIDWLGVESDLQDLSAANIHYVRTIWQQGVRSDTDNDKLMARLDYYKIHMMPTIYHIPQKTAGTDAERAAYREWLAGQVNRYKAFIHQWEASNEPNGPTFWNIDNSDTSDQALYEAAVLDYITFLQDTYTTIKANDPTAEVLLGGLSEWKFERWMDAFIKFEGYKYVDKVAFHPYGNSPDRNIERLNALKVKMATNSTLASKPIIINEIGYHTRTSDNPGMYVPTEEMKAEYLRQVMEKLRLRGVEMPVYWYTYEDPWTPENGHGLVTKTGDTLESTTHLPAYTGYKELWDDVNIAILNPVADAYVDSSTPNTNYGRTALLQSASTTSRKGVSYSQSSYFKFDLTPYAGMNISQAILKLKTTASDTAASNGLHSVRLVGDSSWSETGITYSNRPTPPTSAIGGVEPNGVAKWFDITLNPAISSGTFVTLEVDTKSSDNALFSSREADPSALPQLVIYYSLNGAVPTDLSLPSVFITNPANGASLKAGSIITVSAEAFDDVGVTQVEFLINDRLACIDVSPEYNCQFTLANKTGIKYSITAKAYDAVGHTSFDTINIRTSK